MEIMRGLEFGSGWFLWREENLRIRKNPWTREKPPKDENRQQSRLTFEASSGIRTRKAELSPRITP